MQILNIQKIKGRLKEGGEDIYFKISVGPHLFKSKYIENAKKDFDMVLKETFYCDSLFQTVNILAYDKDLFSDDFLGAGSKKLSLIVNGNNIIQLTNKKGQNIG